MVAHLIPRLAESKQSLGRMDAPENFASDTIPPQCEGTSWPVAQKGVCMKNVVMVMAAAGLVTAPVQAADWNDARPGTFVGARLTIGGKTGGRPSAALTIAPTQNRFSSDGMASMKIGEGIALNFTSASKPTLTLAGIRADRVLGLKSGPATDSGKKLGMSDGAKVALGVGAALLIGAGVFYAVATNCADHEDECP